MIIVIIIMIVLFILLIILAGPKVKVDTTLTPVKLPADLNLYLANKESDIPNLTPGTEKTIIWASGKEKKTDYSIIYIHGFTATRQETYPVADRIASSIGANLYYTRLKGHGKDGEALGEARLKDWINDIWEAWEIGRRIGQKVIIIAVSTGAPLAAWLCTKVDNIAALIMMSANFYPADKASGMILWPWGNLLIRLVLGKYHKQFKPINERHSRYWTSTYRSEALLAMMGVCKLGNKLDLDKIKVPVLFLYTENDKAISIPALKEVYEKISSPRKKIINIKEAKDHVIAGDIISPETNNKVVTLVLDFLEYVLK